MEVILAGYNIDAELLEEIKRLLEKLKNGEKINPTDLIDPNCLTPETISAAYARISRDSRQVNELRKIAREEVEKARKSNKSIIYGMGHHSVADHAMFNFDILKVSRLMVEFIEERRLAGYTEKSQRYITLKGDYVRPQEFSAEDLEKFEALVGIQNDYYFRTKEKLFEHLKEKNKERISQLEGEEQKKFLNLLEGSAKEDARYSLSLATEAQLGCSYTGETLELAIRKNKHGELAEQWEFARKLYKEVVRVAPSLVQLTDAELFEQHNPGKKLKEDNFKLTKKHLEEITEKAFKEADSKIYDSYNFWPFEYEENVTLVELKDFDMDILTTLLFKNSKKRIRDGYALANHLKEQGKGKDLIKEALRYVSEFDKVPREFEVCGLIYEIILSASSFAQLKRHRMNTLLAQDYNPELGYTIPPNVEEMGGAKELKEVGDRSSDLYSQFLPKYGKAAEYCLTNAHRRRVLLATNIRQFYHISRTREDGHAQWEIRETAHKMAKLANKAAPLSTILLGGQDKFEEIKKEVYRG